MSVIYRATLCLINYFSHLNHKRLLGSLYLTSVLDVLQSTLTAFSEMVRQKQTGLLIVTDNCVEKKCICPLLLIPLGHSKSQQV